MSFYDAMKQGLFVRLEQIEPTLTRSREYREADMEKEAVLNTLDAETADRLRTSILSLFDLYSRFFYCAGMQDAAKITQDDFPLQMIG